MPLDENDCQAAYKILIIGDTAVGKTALLRTLTGEPFQEKSRPTVAVDFIKKAFEVDGALVQLQLCDTAGQERFRSITRWQYRDTKGIVVVYDVTARDTFQHLSYWIDSINRDVANDRNQYETVPLIILGNKSDRCEHRAVKSREGRKSFMLIFCPDVQFPTNKAYMDRFDNCIMGTLSVFQEEQLADKHMAFGFYETSARTGENVMEAFHKIAYHVTDICDPKLMKSYHPHMLRPPEIVRGTGSTMRLRLPSDKLDDENNERRISDGSVDEELKKKEKKRKPKKKKKLKADDIEMNTLTKESKDNDGEEKQNGDRLKSEKTKFKVKRHRTIKLRLGDKNKLQCCVVS